MRTALTLFTMLFAITAMAAESGNPASQRGACRDEIKQLCGDAKSGDGKMKQCIQANMDKLSPGCRQHIERARSRADSTHQACQADVQKLCDGVSPGGGRLHQCLKKNEAALSTPCRESIQRKPRPAKGAS